MTTRPFGSMTALAALITVLWLAPASVAGQVPTAGTKTSVLPRTPDGQPDVQGFWESEIDGSWNIENAQLPPAVGSQLALNPRRIGDPPGGPVPYQPWAAAKQQEQADNVEYPTKPEYIDP